MIVKNNRSKRTRMCYNKVWLYLNKAHRHETKTSTTTTKATTKQVKVFSDCISTLHITISVITLITLCYYNAGWHTVYCILSGPSQTSKATTRHERVIC